MARKSAAEHIHDGQRAADVAKAKLLLLREGQCSQPPGEVAASIEADLARVTEALRQADHAVTVAATMATHRAQVTAAQLTPQPSRSARPIQPPATTNLPRVEAYVMTAADVIEGSLADLMTADKIEQMR